jgi:RNA polymerase sigma-70 factor (ECF subfamily)
MNGKFYSALKQVTGSQSQFATLTDKQIFQQVLQGETHLFELIMRRYNRRLFRIARSILRNNAEAEDALQESYILAYLHLRDFQGSSSAGAWLSKITVNESLSRWRRGTFRQVSSDGNESDFDNLFEEASSPEHFAHANQVLWLIESAVDRLPAKYRTVFVLRAVEQLSVIETAEHLNINPATVKTRYHRAKSLLQKMLDHRLEAVTAEAFSFGGQNCDRLVEAVFRRLAGELK